MKASIFISAGYEYIGMDHFAKSPSDKAWPKAQKQGELPAEFSKGYTTHAGTDLVAFGVSAH